MPLPAIGDVGHHVPMSGRGSLDLGEALVVFRKWAEPEA